MTDRSQSHLEDGHDRTYEPPAIRSLGKVEELTSVADGSLTLDAG